MTPHTQQNQDFAALADLTRDAVLVATREGRILWCNRAAGLLFLRQEADFEGLPLRALVLPKQAYVFERLLGEPMLDADRLEAACVREDGTSFTSEISARHVPMGLVVCVHDLTLQKKEEEALRKANEAFEYLSFTDALTGLGTRGFFEAYIARDAARSLKAHLDKDPSPHKDLLFFLVDLDHFKWVNDVHGAAAGDAMLQQLAAILTNAMRQTDLVVRWGGEAFLLVAREANRSEAPIVAERVRKAVERQLFDLGTSEIIRGTCSLGWAPYPFVPEAPELLTLGDVLSIADHALYAAKQSQRNAWVGLEGLSPLAVHPAHPRILHQTAELIAQSCLRLTTNLGDEHMIRWG